MPDKLKSQVSSSRPRDERGHFISVPTAAEEGTKLVKEFLASHTGNYKDQEDLLDIRIGNPLRRVIELLEDIKNQKAFSFTLKGSLGIAGVVLLISAFGLFGGDKIICDRGTQTEIGTIRILEAREIYSKNNSLIQKLLGVEPQKKIVNRTVLIQGGATLYIPYSENINFSTYSNQQVIVTGNLNSCSNTLTLDDPQGMEIFIK